MRTTILFILCHLLLSNIFAQTFTTNTTPVGLEHNILFDATHRYTVNQTGAAQVNLEAVFDGKLSPSYTSVGVNSSSPTIIEITGLPSAHTQRGAWIGWTTRWWQARRFKIEAYDVYYGNGWVTVADYTNTDYTGGQSYIEMMPAGSYTKLKFTIYSAAGTDGRLGISELFYIHPEVSQPYAGLYKTYSSLFESNNSIGIGTSTPSEKLELQGNTCNILLDNTAETESGIIFKDNQDISGHQVAKILYNSNTTDDNKLNFYNNDLTNPRLTIAYNGNIGIGIVNPQNKLDVNGTIHAREVKINLDGWSDFVFSTEYNLRSLEETEQYIKTNGHLPDIPSANKVKEEGVSLGEMDARLLQKIEELTLYTIEQQKTIDSLIAEINNLKKDIKNEN